MKLDLGRGWQKKLKGQVEQYDFEVGIFDETIHKNPVEHSLFGQPNLTTYAGGPVRRTSREAGNLTVGQVLINNMERLNINLLLRPFQERNSELLKFTDYFVRLALKRPGISIKRVENLLQAIVRNPILKQEYGPNSSQTADAKGFNRNLFDTGQMFKAIRARVKKRV